MTFSEIPDRMRKLGVDRDWMCKKCKYSAAHVANALAPNGNAKSKTEKALARMWEELDREEARQAEVAANPPFQLQQLVLRPSDADYERWCLAANGVPVNKWALQALNDAASRLKASGLSVVPTESENHGQSA